MRWSSPASSIRANQSRRSYGASVRFGAAAAFAAALSAVSILAAPDARAAEKAASAALKYETAIDGLGDDAMLAVLKASLRSYRFEEDGAPSLALLKRRAKTDLETIERLLRAEGYYAGEARVKVEEGRGSNKAKVAFSVKRGRPFILAAHDFDFDGAPLDRTLSAKALGSPLGARAEAAKILAAEAAALDDLRRKGRPYAALADRSVEADYERAELRVRSRIANGPAAVFGPLVIRGAEGVDRDYLKSYLTWAEGETFNTEALAAYERAIAATGLFDLAAVSKPVRPPRGRSGPVATPVTLDLSAAPERSVGLGGRYSTDRGASARASFEHRNLAGANEKLTAVLDAGAEAQSLKTEFRKPQFLLRPGQDLVASATLRRAMDDAFDEQTATATLGLERSIGTLLGGNARVGFGALAEVSLIDDASTVDGAEAQQTSYLLGAPVFLSLDARDDPLNPTAGYRLRVSATPFLGSVEEEGASFLTLDAGGAAYQALDDDARLVLAARGRIGLIVSEDLAQVPAQRRLYSGGGGSVRGYALRFVGPLDASGDPIGGRSALELGGELRWRATEDFGAVAFVEGGVVSTETASLFDDDLRVGVGPGLRYYSPIGPVGVDVGLPIDPRPEDAAYQLYFFIGQAF